MIKLHQRIVGACVVISLLIMSVPLTAKSAPPIPPTALPGSADAARIHPEDNGPVIDHSHDADVEVPNGNAESAAPETAKAVHFTLKDVRIEGSTIYSDEKFKEFYAEYLGKDVTLEIAWDIANKVTALYRNDGYFLSRAYVPAQDIKDGIITMRVVEGYIGKVEIDQNADDYVIQAYINDVTAQKPAKARDVESFLLRLNDLPGYSFRAVLAPIEDAGNLDEAAVKMSLVPADKDGRGTLSFDNYSSRFLGPHELSLSYSTSLIPLEQTTVSGFTSLPAHELKYGSVDQQIAIYPDVTLEINAAKTQAYPGYNLEKFDIDSESNSVTASLVYQWLRQRDENLSVKLSFDARNNTTDILDTPLTRDRIRALRISTNFDLTDDWNGYNSGSITYSHGIDSVGASDEFDPDISRAGAKPDFKKLEFTFSRLQELTSEFSAIFTAAGQLASGPLYSSEQFGYGGQAFGRAFDPSEITGDDGLSGSIEIRYMDFATLDPVGLTPYGFYDIGEVWNEGDEATIKEESGSSAGFGVRFTAPYEVSGNLGLAFPLTRKASDPIYGGNGKSPRVLFQISKNF